MRRSGNTKEKTPSRHFVVKGNGNMGRRLRGEVIRMLRDFL